MIFKEGNTLAKWLLDRIYGKTWLTRGKTRVKPRTKPCTEQESLSATL